eukprot:XP_016656578.1 PREDICTED: putative uncharacterized protein DDB_G0282133 isoform X2 [Acyrthosiphon pisum]
MWSIVCFIDEDTIECVPNFWLKNSLCAWPNKDCKIKSQLAVERRLAPNSIEFGYYNARPLARNITNLNEAYKKLKLAEETSELSNVKKASKKKHKRLKCDKQSSSRQIVNKLRVNRKSSLIIDKNRSIPNSPPKYDAYKKKRDNNMNNDNGNQSAKNSFSKSDKNNTTQIEVFDSANENSKETIVNNIKSIDTYYADNNQTENKLNEISSSSSDIVDDNDDSDVDETYKPFVKNHSSDVLLSPGNIDPDLNYKIMNNNMAHQNVNKTSTPVARKRDNDLFKCISDDDETVKSHFEEYSQQKKKKLTNSFYLNSNDNNITSEPKQSSTDEMLRSLIRSVTNIKYELKDMTAKIDRIEERQTNMMHYAASNDYPCNSSGNVLHTNSIDETWNFPLTSFEELDGFEQNLLDDGYKIKLISYLRRLEKPTIGAMTREILAKLFHNDLLAQFSYVGQKGKKIFSVLNTCSILFAAVRSVKNYKNCTDLDIIKPLKPYLANATARGKPKTKD